MLADVIGKLATVLSPISGAPLCRPGRLQYYVPIIPPGAQVPFIILPPFGAYAAIKYGMTYDCLPGTIYLETSHSGNLFIQGIIEQDWMGYIVPYMITYTEASPIEAFMLNISNLNQRFIGTQYMLSINSEEEFDYFKQVLQSNKEEILLEQVVQLLGGKRR